MSRRGPEAPRGKSWHEAVLEELVAPGDGLQTGPFGNQLHADEYVSKGIPVVMPKDLREGTIRQKNLARVSATKAHALSRHRVRPGDLLLARRGQVGRCALVGPAEAGWICGTGCVRIRPGRRVDPRFLLQYLTWAPMVAWFRDNAVGQTMANLSTKILARTPLLLPPLEEQHHICDILARLTSACETQAAVLEHTRRLAIGLLDRALHPSIAPNTQAPPSGWTTRRVGDLCQLVNGFRFKASDWTDTGLPIIRIQNLNGSQTFKKFAGYARPTWIVRPGDILFAWSGVRASLGPRRWTGPEGVLNQHIFRVRPGENVDKDWLFEALRALMPALAAKTQGFKSTLVHIRKGDLVNLTLALPPAEIQQQIGSWSRRLEELCVAEQDHLGRLGNLRSATCDILLTGRAQPRS